jgi:Transposase DDE domain group 1
MPDDTPLSVPYPAVARKKVTAAFDGGRLSSDSGVMLVSLAERRRGIANALAALIADPRDPAHVTHTVEDVLRARMLAIACGYPDGNDLNWLRSDPAFKLACGRLPETGADLCSQPTISRWENAPTLREIVRLTYALIDIWCRSYAKPPVSAVLDIDDTLDVAHGHREMAEWNAHYDERCFLPIHIYDTATGRPVTMILRPGKTPSGKEVRRWLRRPIGRIRRHWPKTRIAIRGDGHYGRDEAMSRCEDNGAVTFLALAATPCSTGWLKWRQTVSVHAAPRRNSPFSAVMPKPAMRPNRGRENAASRPGSKRRKAMRTTCCGVGSISGTLSPR